MRDPNVTFNALHKTCTLVVLLCCLHILVTVVYYVKSLDNKQSFVQNSQHNRQTFRKLEQHPGTTEVSKSDNTLVSNNTVKESELEKCPDTSPLLAPGANSSVTKKDGEETFNRAKLLNVGYAEALKEYDYECFVFSDVDLIPMDDRNTYKCFEQPRHLSVSMDKFGFRLPYNQYFGGVSSLSKEQYLKINGFPNNYWGWGGEDDDIYNRVTAKGMSISRPNSAVGKCRMIRHERDQKNDPNPQRFDRIAHTRETMHKDGINSLSYEVVRVEKDQLFTKITVDIGKP